MYLLILSLMLQVTTILSCTNSSQCVGAQVCRSGGKCVCDPPNFGLFCELKNCSPPCTSNQTCHNQTGTCQCQTPFYGNNCQFLGTECPVECLNGGTCSFAGGTCLCPNGYEGSRCEQRKCIPACKNGGVCVSRNQCQCSNGTYGELCEFFLADISITDFPVIFGVMIGLIVFCCGWVIYVMIILLAEAICLCRNLAKKKKKKPAPKPKLSLMTQSSIRIPMHIDVEAGRSDVQNLGLTDMDWRRSHLIRNQYYNSDDSVENPANNTETTVAYIDPETLAESPNRNYEFLTNEPHIATNGHCIANPHARSGAGLNVGFYKDSDEYIFADNKQGPALPPKPRARTTFEETRRRIRKQKSNSYANEELIIYETIGEEDNQIDKMYSMLSKPNKNERRCVVLSNDERSSLPEHKTSYSTFPGMLKQRRATRYFRESPIYDKPSTTLDKLFDQMSAMNFREIMPDTLIQAEHLGEGEFGVVCKGVWISRLGEIPVAVKTLKDPCTEEKKVGLFQEALIMGQFSHPNIIRILGIVSIQIPYAIVSELMKSEMLDFLRTVRFSQIDLNKLPPLLLRFCREIAAGMQYLASKRFVHRDLAARNILIASNYTIRIADFGMAREIINNRDYYSSSGGNIPVRWTAPEALFHQMYSEKSDVWSFGMTMFEIWSLGLSPWYNLSNEEVVQALHSQRVHPPPTGCPRDVYFIIVEALRYDTKKRCVFTQFRQMLEAPIVLQKPTTGSNADVLGNDPNLAKNLHLDLQTKYLY